VSEADPAAQTAPAENGQLPPSSPEQLFDPEHPEKALAAAFAGGLLFAALLRRVRS